MQKHNLTQSSAKIV